MRNLVRSRARLTTTVGAGIVVALALSACGSSGSGGSSTGVGSATPTDAGSSSAAAPTTLVNGVEIAVDPTAAALLPEQYKSAIRIVTSAPYPPFEYFDDSQKLIGLDIDTGDAIAAVLGTKSEWTSIDYNGVIPALQANKYDMVLASIGDTPEREQVLDFVNYSKQGQILLVPAGNPEGITALTDMCGKTLAVEAGNVTTEYFAELDKYCADNGKDKMTVKELPKTSDALLALKSGGASAQYLGVATAADLKSKPEGAGYDIVTPADRPFGYLPRWVGAGIPKNSPELRDAVAAALKVLIDTGALDQLYAKYGQQQILTGAVEINKIVEEPLVP